MEDRLEKLIEINGITVKYTSTKDLLKVNKFVRGVK